MEIVLRMDCPTRYSRRRTLDCGFPGVGVLVMDGEQGQRKAISSAKTLPPNLIE